MDKYLISVQIQVLCTCMNIMQQHTAHCPLPQYRNKNHCSLAVCVFFSTMENGCSLLQMQSFCCCCFINITKVWFVINKHSAGIHVNSSQTNSEHDIFYSVWQTWYDYWTHPMTTSVNSNSTDNNTSVITARVFYKIAEWWCWQEYGKPEQMFLSTQIKKTAYKHLLDEYFRLLKITNCHLLPSL